MFPEDAFVNQMTKKLYAEGESFIVSEEVDLDTIDLDKMTAKPGLSQLINEFKRAASSKNERKGESFETKNNDVVLNLTFGKGVLSFQAVFFSSNYNEEGIEYSLGMLMQDAMKLNNLLIKSRHSKKNKKSLNLKSLILGSEEDSSQDDDLNLTVKKVSMRENYKEYGNLLVSVQIEFVSNDL